MTYVHSDLEIVRKALADYLAGLEGDGSGVYLHFNKAYDLAEDAKAALDRLEARIYRLEAALRAQGNNVTLIVGDATDEGIPGSGQVGC